MEAVLDIFTGGAGIIGGGIGGLLVGCIKSFIGFLETKENNKHKLQILKAETEAMRAEKELEIQSDAMKSIAELEVEEIRAMVESMRDETANKEVEKLRILQHGKYDDFIEKVYRAINMWSDIALGWVMTYRSFFRMGITTVVFGYLLWYNYHLNSVIENKGGLALVDVADLFKLQVSLVQHLMVTASTALGFWFSGRGDGTKKLIAGMAAR